MLCALKTARNLVHVNIQPFLPVGRSNSPVLHLSTEDVFGVMYMHKSRGLPMVIRNKPTSTFFLFPVSIHLHLSSFDPNKPTSRSFLLKRVFPQLEFHFSHSYTWNRWLPSRLRLKLILADLTAKSLADFTLKRIAQVENKLDDCNVSC